MIVREVQFADGPPQWLLISQVEHALLSGELARRCIDKFGGTDSTLHEVRDELLQAIIHHDDGWAEWESNPRLDPQTGKPLSFMELPVAEALHVWQASIESASRHGDLAAWVVSGHFSSLLCTIGHHGHDLVAREWLKQTASKRSQWFATWHARNVELHTAEVAGEALKWLQLFDILSLWPCAQYPVTGEVIRKQPEPLNIDNWMLVREIHPHFELTDNKRPRIVFSPWPFEEPEIAIIAAAHLVPVRKYASAAELLAARVPLVAEWKLAAE